MRNSYLKLLRSTRACADRDRKQRQALHAAACLWNPYIAGSSLISLLYGVLSISWCGRTSFKRDDPMTFDTHQEAGLAELPEQLRRAQAVTPELMAGVIARACPRFPGCPPAAKTRIIRFVESGAFVDAALALLGLELPGWQLRRLVYDDGEWFCSLSKYRELPDWLDVTLEARHRTLSLAIFTAFVEAQSRAGADRVGSPTVPAVSCATHYALCCDNFA